MTGRILLTSALALMLMAQPAAAFCKLALALGLDISSSVNEQEYRLQLEGLAHALETDAVTEAILTPEGGHISAIVYEWSGYAQQDVIIGWTVLDSVAAIRSFATRLRAHRRLYTDLATAVGKGVEYGAQLLARSPDCGRKVLDISGDGENNIGVGPEYFRELGVLDGITINGLVVLGAVPDPAAYYRGHVIQGPGAFVALARDFTDYQDVMVDKLLREIDIDLIVGER